MSQTNRNFNNSSQPQSGGPSPLQNKGENDRMMNTLKNFDSKLQADGASSGAAPSQAHQSSESPASTGAGAPSGNKKQSTQGGEERKSLKAVGGQATKSQDSSESGSKEGTEESDIFSKFKSMSFELNKAVDLTKGYLAKDKTAPYLGKLGSEVGEQVVEYVKDWAEKNNAKIDVKIVGVKSETPLYTGVGATAGAGIGYALGGKMGAAVGAIFGAALGTAASCVDVNFGTDKAAESTAPVVH